MKEKTYVCDRCEGCKCTKKGGFTPGGQCLFTSQYITNWIELTTSQTNVAPEPPLFILNIPELTPSKKAELVAALNKLSEIGDPITWGQKESLELRFNDPIPGEWLKPAPIKPTAEELQTRLDSICEFVKNEISISTGSTSIIYDLANG